MTASKFSRSFFFKTQPPQGQPCCLKWHYGGVMREIVGYYDSQARKRADRFVYAKYETVRAHCKKFNKMDFSESAFWQGIRELRARRIISKQVEREVWVNSGKKGHKVLRKLTGNIVAHHDCVTHMEGDVCVFHGPMQCGRWERLFDTEPAKQVDGEIFFDNTPSAVLYWAGCAKHAPAVPQQCSSSAPAVAACAGESAAPVQDQVQPVCSARTVPSAVVSAVADSGQTSYLSEDNPKNGGQAVVTVIPGVAEEPRKPEQPVEPAPPVQAAAQIKTQTGPSPSSSLSGAGAPNQRNDDKPPGSESTIGAQFLLQKEDMDLLIQLTDGIFNPHAYKETGEIDVLVKYARAAVAEDAALPWDKQRTTLAKIVDQVAKCAAAEGLKQKGWFKSLKELQQGGPCKKDYPPPPLTNAQQLAANRAQGFVGIPVTQRHGMNGQTMYLCADKIYRLAGDRDHNGFTVQAADGVWDRP